MIGDYTLRTYNASSSAQRAITFLCLNFNGVSVTYNSLPPTTCPNGVRAQIVSSSTKASRKGHIKIWKINRTSQVVGMERFGTVIIISIH